MKSVRPAPDARRTKAFKLGVSPEVRAALYLAANGFRPLAKR
jgi:hypothetical protein